MTWCGSTWQLFILTTDCKGSHIETKKWTQMPCSCKKKKPIISFTYIISPCTDLFIAEDHLFSTPLSIPLKEESKDWKVDIKLLGSILQIVQLDTPWRAFIRIQHAVSLGRVDYKYTGLGNTGKHPGNRTNSFFKSTHFSTETSIRCQTEFKH